MNKEELKSLVDEGIQESFSFWSDFMSEEEFEQVKPLLGITVMLCLGKIRKPKEKTDKTN